jgi:hypothetical protein
MQVSKIDDLNRLLDEVDYEADAVSMNQDSLIRLRNEFQQRFEKNYVDFKDLENYFGLKILLLHETSGKKEFDFYRKLEKRN